MCVSKSNNLIVSDTFNHRIQIFDIGSSDLNNIGLHVTSFGSYGKKHGSFRFPKGVTTDDEGFIMVADWKNNRLQLFEPLGDFVTVISSSAFSKSIKFDKPVGISSLSNGGIVFSNWGRSQTIEIL